MQLDEIFRRRRKTESTALVICRAFIMIMVIALLAGYMTLLIIDIFNDVPILKTEARTVSGLRLPTIQLEFDYKFFLGCVLSYTSKLTEHTQCSYLSLYAE